jgi:hypothetical protein
MPGILADIRTGFLLHINIDRYSYIFLLIGLTVILKYSENLRKEIYLITIPINFNGLNLRPVLACNSLQRQDFSS